MGIGCDCFRGAGVARLPIESGNPVANVRRSFSDDRSVQTGPKNCVQLMRGNALATELVLGYRRFRVLWRGLHRPDKRLNRRASCSTKPRAALVSLFGSRPYGGGSEGCACGMFADVNRRPGWGEQ
jgi:hypothetical protein